MKTPLILLHGALGSATQFDALITLFPEDSPVYPLELPGHGSSHPQEPFSLKLFSEAVLQFMDDHNFPSANIFGYSMGGYVALHLASEYPGRVLQVMTYGTKLDWTPEVAAAMNRMFDPEKIEAKVPHFARTLAATHIDWKSLCRYTADFLNDLGNGLGIPEDSFSTISCPVTIGWGSEDNVVSTTESQRVAELIPNGNFVKINGAKHQIELVDVGEMFKFVSKHQS